MLHTSLTRSLQICLTILGLIAVTVSCQTTEAKPDRQNTTSQSQPPKASPQQKERVACTTDICKELNKMENQAPGVSIVAKAGLATRGESCPDTTPTTQLNDPKTTLVALIPIGKRTLTTLAHPTFLVYYPGIPEATHDSFGEFEVISGDGKTSVYSNRIKLPQASSVISLTLPRKVQHSLKLNQEYFWHFSISLRNCSTSSTVTGWVKRVSLPSGRYMYRDFLQQGIWYDAVADLVKRRQAKPNDRTLQKEWQELMIAAQLDEVVSVPFYR